MNNYKCVNAEKKVKGLTQAVWCKKLNDYCVLVRYCPTKGEIELTPESQNCIHNPNRIPAPKD